MKCQAEFVWIPRIAKKTAFLKFLSKKRPVCVLLLDSTHRRENKFLSIGVNVSEDATDGTDTVGRDCIDAMNEFGAVLYSLYRIDVNGEGFYDIVSAYSNGKCDKKDAIEQLAAYGK